MLKIEWQNRFDALEPAALVAFDQAAIRLAQRLLSLDDARLAKLQGVRAANLLLVAGKADDLPWVENVIYLGKDAAAPLILLPTTRRPALPLDVFERALVRRFRDELPFAVLENKIVQIGKMRPIARTILKSWLGEKL